MNGYKTLNHIYYEHLKDKRRHLPPDIEEWIKLTEQGRLYDWIEAKAGFKRKYSRKTLKQKFFAQCFYNKLDAKETEMRRVFKTLFPNVQKEINKLKEKDYKNAPYLMQKQEAQFMIHTVCKRLFEEHPDMPVLTIHDSILTTPAWKDTTQKVMDEEFMRLGVRPTICVKDYGSSS